jgi:hypothetical protein
MNDKLTGIHSSGIGSEFSLSLSYLRPRSDKYLPFQNTPYNHFLFLNSGRAAIKLAWQLLRKKDKTRNICLLPGYLCSSIIQPLQP